MKLVRLVWFVVALSACAQGPAIRLSGPVVSPRGTPVGSSDGLLLGVLADSQLQTRTNYRHVPGYRSPFADALVPVAIRPPALDFTARALLLENLWMLKKNGAAAIFYLGDGANNGCEDEFLAGFDPAVPVREFTPHGAPDPNSEGILAVLARFRAAAGVPVYFIIGNHDFLGAGSTARTDTRLAFCSVDRDHNRTAQENRPVSKARMMKAIDRFNNENTDPRFTYTSNVQGADPSSRCGPDENQFRAPGCYLAARVDTKVDGKSVQLLLLDTGDWRDVSYLHPFGYDQLGEWGGISFGQPSQIDWFQQNASKHVAMRVALMHYDVNSLRKGILGQGLSYLTRRLPDLFGTAADRRTANQDGAFFISAHTHTRVDWDRTRTFDAPDCASRRCVVRAVKVRELNIGSTTDDPSFSTLVRLRPAAGPRGEIDYYPLHISMEQCKDTDADLSKTVVMPDGTTATGWMSFGIDHRDRHNYDHFEYDDAKRVWDQIRTYVARHPGRPAAVCIGREAAKVERG